MLLSMSRMWCLPWWQRICFYSEPSERQCQEWGTPARAYKGSNALVRGKLHLTWPPWEQFGVCWCQLSWLRHRLCAAALPSRSLPLNHLQLSSFCGLIFPPWEPLHQSCAGKNTLLTSLNSPGRFDYRSWQLLFLSS